MSNVKISPKKIKYKSCQILRLVVIQTGFKSTNLPNCFETIEMSKNISIELNIEYEALSSNDKRVLEVEEFFSQIQPEVALPAVV